MNILVINGPNLNLLGIREPEVYGKHNYQDLVDYLLALGEKYHINIDIFQSNHEGEIIDKMHQAYFQAVDGIIVNPGAYAHYSYALRDAIAAVGIKTVEVHLTAITRREPFRHYSVISDVCTAIYYGMGFTGYEKAIKLLIGDKNEIS